MDPASVHAGSCHPTRLADYNTFCSRNDVLSYWGTNDLSSDFDVVECSQVENVNGSLWPLKITWQEHTIVGGSHAGTANAGTNFVKPLDLSSSYCDVMKGNSQDLLWSSTGKEGTFEAHSGRSDHLGGGCSTYMSWGVPFNNLHSHVIGGCVRSNDGSTDIWGVRYQIERVSSVFQAAVVGVPTVFTTIKSGIGLFPRTFQFNTCTTLGCSINTTTASTTLPNPPLSVAVRVYDEDTLQVTIAPPLNDGGANITEYKITYTSTGPLSLLAADIIPVAAPFLFEKIKHTLFLEDEMIFEASGSLVSGGISNRVVMPAAGLIGGPFSFSGWVKSSDSTLIWNRVFDIGNGPNSDNVILGFLIETGKMYYSVLHGSADKGRVITTAVFPDNYWVFVQLVHRANETVTIYWDRMEKATGILPLPLNLTRTWYLGKSHFSSADKDFVGSMKDIIFFNLELQPYRSLPDFQRAFQVVGIDSPNSHPDGSYFQYVKAEAEAACRFPFQGAAQQFHVHNSRTEHLGTVVVFSDSLTGRFAVSPLYGSTWDASRVAADDWAIGDYLTCLDEPMYWNTQSSFTVVRNDHKNHPVGKYFGFLWRKAEKAYGFPLVVGDYAGYYLVRNERSGIVRAVRLFSGNEFASGGAEIDGHGRYEPFSSVTTSDWLIGDSITFMNAAASDGIPAVRNKVEVKTVTLLGSRLPIPMSGI